MNRVVDKDTYQNVWRNWDIKVYSTDLIDRGYGNGNIDFLKLDKLPYGDCQCILTNPPYKLASEVVLKSLDLLNDGGYCIMFLKTIFLEGKKEI